MGGGGGALKCGLLFTGEVGKLEGYDGTDQLEFMNFLFAFYGLRASSVQGGK